jgi:hypothetical protein
MSSAGYRRRRAVADQKSTTTNSTGSITGQAAAIAKAAVGTAGASGATEAAEEAEADRREQRAVAQRLFEAGCPM